MLIKVDYADIALLQETTTLRIAETAQGSLRNFPQVLYNYIYDSTDGDLFSMRLPGMLFLIAGLFYWFFLGKKLLGEWVTTTAILIMCSTFAILNLSKFAVGDVWILIANLFLFTSVLLNIKQDQLKWKILFGVSLVFSYICQPFQASLFTVVLFATLFFFHPQGKRLKNPLYWGSPVLLMMLSIFMGLYNANNPNTYFSWGSLSPLEYLWKNFAAVLVWLGFLMGAFKDLFQKIRKGEELSIILLCWLLAAMASLTISLQAVFAVLIAKQLHSFRQKNYPNYSIVNAFSVLQLIGSFFIAYYLMISGFETTGINGYRNGMIIGIAYWVFNFIGVLGLYSKQIRWTMGGFVMAGVFALFLFWMRTEKANLSNTNDPAIEELHSKQSSKHQKRWG